MPLQDALTGAGIMNLPYGPFPLPVPLITVVGAPLRLPPFDGETLKSRQLGAGRAGTYCAAGAVQLHGVPAIQQECTGRSKKP